jgi:hypothetical protein
VIGENLANNLTAPILSVENAFLVLQMLEVQQGVEQIAHWGQ